MIYYFVVILSFTKLTRLIFFVKNTGVGASGSLNCINVSSSIGFDVKEDSVSENSLYLMLSLIVVSVNTELESSSFYE